MKEYTELYKAKGYTRTTLAALYGVCPDSISNRAKNPTPEQLLALAGLPEKDKQEESTDDTNNRRFNLRRL